MIFCGHHKFKTPKLVIFYDVQISRKKKKMHHVQGQKSSIKCAYRERGSKLIVVRTHMNYLFLIENENLLLSQCCTHFILPSEFSISIHVTNCSILDKYENQKIRISFYASHFFAKGAAQSSELLIYFKYNNHIQDGKLVLEERNMNEMIIQ